MVAYQLNLRRGQIRIPTCTGFLAESYQLAIGTASIITHGPHQPTLTMPRANTSGGGSSSRTASGSGGGSEGGAKLSSRENAVYNTINRASEKCVTADELGTMFPEYDINTMMELLNELLAKNLLKTERSGSTIRWTAVSKQQANLIGRLDPDEQIVYQCIREGGNEGIWSKHIKDRTKLHQSVANRCLKTLEQKSVIKTVKSVKHPTRKIYMLYDVTPSAEISGGPWYSETELDTEFIKLLCDICEKFVERCTWPTDSAANSRFSVEQLGLLFTVETQVSRLPTATKVLDYVRRSGVVSSSIHLDVKNIVQILSILIYDGKLEKFPMLHSQINAANGSLASRNTKKTKNASGKRRRDDSENEDQGEDSDSESETSDSESEEDDRKKRSKGKGKGKEKEAKRKSKGKSKEKSKSKSQSKSKKSSSKKRKRKDASTSESSEEESESGSESQSEASDDSEDDSNSEEERGKSKKKQKKSGSKDKSGKKSKRASLREILSDSDEENSDSEDDGVASLLAKAKARTNSKHGKKSILKNSKGKETKETKGKGKGKLDTINLADHEDSDERGDDEELEEAEVAAGGHGDGGAFVYRSVRKLTSAPLAFTQVPCGQCPVFDFCSKSGPTNAEECAYFDKWLDQEAAIAGIGVAPDADMEDQANGIHSHLPSSAAGPDESIELENEWQEDEPNKAGESSAAEDQEEDVDGFEEV